MTRRSVAAGLALAALIGVDVAVVAADGGHFAERFVTFDPPVPMRPITLLDRRGRGAVLSPRRDRTTLIALWASWCPACHRDVPRLAAVQQTLAKEGIDVALVNVEAAPPASVLAQSADMSTGAVPLLFDPDGRRLAASSSDGRRSPFQPSFGMPIVFVVDRSELVRGYVRGLVDWTSPDVRAFFLALTEADVGNDTGRIRDRLLVTTAYEFSSDWSATPRSDCQPPTEHANAKVCFPFAASESGHSGLGQCLSLVSADCAGLRSARGNEAVGVL